MSTCARLILSIQMVTDDGVEMDDELAHTGSQGHIPAPFGFTRGLDGHYATDSIYSNKLIGRIIEPHNLTLCDLK